MAIATPIGTPVNMQILPAGYKFSDYVKIGGPLWLIFMIAVCLTAKGYSVLMGEMKNGTV